MTLATSAQYVDSVYYRITKGKPQPQSQLWRVAVQATLNPALQRLADRVAADDKLYTVLVNQYTLTLTGGEASVSTLTPTLLMSRGAREHWRVTMTGVRFPLKYRENRIDLDNPPPTQDYYFYNIFNKMLTVRDSTGAIPAETDVQFYGNYVPLISDTAFSTTGELFDNLVDVGAAIIMESASLEEVVRQAETAAATAPPQPPPTG